MGKLCLFYSEEDTVYVCKCCGTHLTTYKEIVSKTFHGKTGEAYLFDKVYNVGTGISEDKQLSTGLHRVRDIYCKVCVTVVGWTYDIAFVPSEKYKEGKAVIELFYIKKVKFSELHEEMLKKHSLSQEDEASHSTQANSIMAHLPANSARSSIQALPQLSMLHHRY
ncbi:hypothetical protein FGO68_gene5631 [Halteria grandinella]|uniref:Protein yippee-like n=1 Tax=Halteria grandinella TaxID=5974 RepID=A0A8J8T8N8_HALGN|nr:hypothetical protein FGO68_gene5631 [Halteria grandinella]